jgi:hypothetical protein
MPPFVARTIWSRNAWRTRQHSPEQLLGLAENSASPVESVHVGGVDEVHPALEGDLDETLRITDLMTDEPPLPKAQRTYLAERSQSSTRADVEGHLRARRAIIETLV